MYLYMYFYAWDSATKDFSQRITDTTTGTYLIRCHVRSNESYVVMVGSEKSRLVWERFGCNLDPYDEISIVNRLLFAFMSDFLNFR